MTKSDHLFRKAILCWALLVLFGLAGCASVLNAATSREGISIRSGIRYSEGPRGVYDLYIPDAASASTPIVVFFYGGSWDSGDRDDYLFVGQSLAAAGVITVIPDYRVYPEVVFPEFVKDGAQAVSEILKASRVGRAGIPAGDHPIFLMGHSAGAHIAALLSYDERYLRAAGVPPSAISGFIGLSGPYDFLPLTSERYKRIFLPETRAASQPVNFADASDPPALLISGLEDRTVEPRNTQALAQSIRQAGGQAEVRLYPDLGHIEAIAALATAIPGDSEIRQAVLSFIRQRSASQVP